jgi:hypothetical protein
MYKILLPFVIATVLLSSCGYYAGVTQPADKSFLKFSGNYENVLVQIDNSPMATYKSTSGQEKSKIDDKTLYQISSGKHMIKIYRDGSLIVSRILFIENYATAEVIIP